MKIPKKVWINGKFLNGEDANISILTHSLHYGSGVFEGIRVYETDKGPAIFRLEDHLNRLLFSAKTIGMEVPYSKQEMKDALSELIRLNEVENGYLRPLLFYGNKIGLTPGDAEVNLALIALKWDSYLGNKPVKVHISQFIRPHPKSTVSEAKISGIYYNSILASLDAKKAGCDEALLLDHEGNIAEGPGENIFFIQGKKLITPKAGNILSGITKNSIQEYAPELGFTIEERTISLKEAIQFDEAFFTGTAAEITQIEQIDKRYYQLDKGNEIKEYYDTIVHGKASKYSHWLTWI